MITCLLVRLHAWIVTFVQCFEEKKARSMYRQSLFSGTSETNLKLAVRKQVLEQTRQLVVIWTPEELNILARAKVKIVEKKHR